MSEEVILSVTEQAVLKPPIIYYCQNPECNKQIDPHKWKNRQKHCDRACQRRHLEILRGVCARPGCGKPLPPGKNAKEGKKFCSLECHAHVHFVPRTKCAREECNNMTKTAHNKYCSVECFRMIVNYKEMTGRAVKMQIAIKQVTGKRPKHDKRSAATSRNNKIAPPRKKMHREDIYCGYRVMFDPDEKGKGYRAYTPEVAGVIARAKTKKEAFAEIKKQLKASGVALEPARTRQAKAQAKTPST